jgi:RNA polymerase sigma-70 factor (ECF subfamily)
MDEGVTARLDPLLRQRAWLRRLAASLVVDAARADDVAQQALIVALEKPPAGGAPRAWLATVARNLARKLGASERTRTVHERAAAKPERLPATDEVVARAALETEVALAVLALAEPYRTALLLRFYEGRPPRASAPATQVAVETVRTRIKRGLELLRAEIVTRRASGASSSGATGAGATSAWALDLVSLLDGGLRQIARRAVLAKASAANLTFVGGGAFAALGLVGGIAMSTSVKLALAAVVVAGVSAAGWFVLGSGDSTGSGSRVTAHNSAAVAPAATAPSVEPASATAPVVEPVRAPVPQAAAPAKHAEKESAKDSHRTCSIVGTVLTSTGAHAAGAVVLLENLDEGGPNFSRSFGSNGTFASLESACNNIEQYVRDLPEGHRGGDSRLHDVGADGRFRFDGIAIGNRVNLAAVHRTEGLAVVAGIMLAETDTEREVDVTLVPGSVVTGIVRDEQGAPVPSAAIRVYAIKRKGSHSTSSSGVGDCKPDASGRYRTLPMPFAELSVRVTAKEFFDTEANFVVDPTEREHRTDFTLVRAVGYRGRVLRPDGGLADLAHVAPPADDHGHGGVEVYASEHDPLEGDAHRFNGDRGELDVEHDRYSVSPHRPGTNYVSLWCKGVCLGASNVVNANGELDITIDPSRIPPPPPPPPGVMELEVVDARDGSPVVKFEVTWDDVNRNLWGRQYDSPVGRHRTEQIDPGLDHVWIWADGFAPLRKDIQVAAPPAGGVVETVRFELQVAAAKISGRILSDDGQPLPQAKVVLLTPDGGRALPPWGDDFQTRDDGAYAFKAIGAGDYLVEASANGFGTERASCTTTATAAATLDVTLHPARKRDH